MNSGGDDERWEAPDATTGHETYTSFEGGVTLGGATVKVKFSINANTGHPIVQTVFGPCLAKGKNATEKSDIVAGALRGEVQSGKDHQFICQQEQHRMASALCIPMRPDGMLDYRAPPGRHKAINALTQAEKNPDNAPARLSRIIQQQKRRHIDGDMIRDMMIQKKSFLALDWPMRAVTAKGSTKTFQMMVNQQGWTNIEKRSCYGSSEPVSSNPDTVNIISRLQQLEKLIGERRRRDSDDSPVSVHIWMSLYDWMCMRGCGWQVTRSIIDSLLKTLSDLVNVCRGMVIVRVNRDVAFHGGRGGLGTIANKVSEICKAAGALVTENDRMWRVTHALAGKNYKIPGTSNLQYYLLKRLLVEKFN